MSKETIKELNLVTFLINENAYLFDKNASPLVQQKHNREFEIFVEESILKTIRESIPSEAIVRAYLDESVEQEEEIVEEIVVEKGESKEAEEVEIKEPEPPPSLESGAIITNISEKPVVNRLSFDDVDHALNEDGREEKIDAPKSIDRLEEISVARNLQRKTDEDDDDDEDRLKIGADLDSMSLGFTDLNPDSFSSGSNDIIKLDFDEL